MTNQDSLTKEEAIKANIYVHSFLANAGEYNKSPHFRPENQEKVRRIIQRLTTDVLGNTKSKAIDFGCGTGFMIHLMHDLFVEVHGVDVTHDMMKQVDLSSGNIYLHESLAEDTPFESGTFDFATAYSFMDHLFNYKDFLSEAYRVLKPGGIFYSDLNPNRDFILAIDYVEKASNQQNNISPIVAREVQGALHNGAYYEQQFGMDGNLLEKAEPIKSLDKGFNAQEVISTAQEIGFTQCNVEYEWFLGQAKVMHEQSKEDSEIVENYLNSVLPVSSHLFKYLRFVFIK
jgi:ubiquinone/menaquinone biosynthesis C-methylase UbiE